MSRSRRTTGGLAAAAATGALLASQPLVGASGSPVCAEPHASRSDTARVNTALAAGDDVFGKKLLAASGGPTYAGVRRLLAPIRYARGRGGASVTASGTYYVVFAQPLSLYGEKAFALHVADGSQVVTRRSDGPSLTVYVGDGAERYGSCSLRLAEPRLAGGYLPILETSYVDANGVRYRQESFAGRVPGVESLVSFVRLEVDTRGARSNAAFVRLVTSAGSRARLVTGGRGAVGGNGASYRVRGRVVIRIAWVHRPSAAVHVAVDEAAYDAARRGVVDFWQSELARGVRFDVPERRVMDAQRHLLVQQRILTWRYSIGNNYEELSFAEALDAAQVMAAYGHADVSRAILRFALKRLPVRYTNWRAGAVLVAAANHVALTGDAALLEDSDFSAVVGNLERQILRAGGTGLLDREAFSSDISRRVAALHGQAVAWRGLQAIGRAWAGLGREDLARRAREAAGRLGDALRRAVRESQVELGDGSLFVPAALLDGALPFDRVTASREGSYWNLVMPYALASGLFSPTGPTAGGIWLYMQSHGSLLLGLVRADADRLYRGAPYPATGIDQVYGLNLARYLADADFPDQLVLSLYGTLGAAMTPHTFVSGEAVSVAPLDGQRYRSMYLPPNGGANTAFLETLRLGLVHESRDAQGAPTGLELAFATPRSWLAEGKTIRVRDAPTSFGPVSYTIVRRGRVVSVAVDAPAAPKLRLRLRLPGLVRIASVDATGRRVPVDASGTLDLSGRRGALRLTVRLRG